MEWYRCLAILPLVALALAAVGGTLLSRSDVDGTMSSLVHGPVARRGKERWRDDLHV